MTTSSHSQQTIFVTQQQLQFSELCNALYEQELQRLANTKDMDMERLQRNIASLTYHVHNAATVLLKVDSPLTLDIHNGSWSASQSARVPLANQSLEQVHKWYQKYAAYGMPVPVALSSQTLSYIELDAIDTIDSDNQKLRLNKNGWFGFNGDNLNPGKDQKPTSVTEIRDRHLLKPGKRVLTAACCGHRWTPIGKTLQRTPSLREMLLSACINWEKPQSPVRIASDGLSPAQKR